jgi:hypothetical protein
MKNRFLTGLGARFEMTSLIQVASPGALAVLFYVHRIAFSIAAITASWNRGRICLMAWL